MEYPNFKLFCENRPGMGWFQARNRADVEGGNVQILDCEEDSSGRDTVEFECPLCHKKHWSLVVLENG